MERNCPNCGAPIDVERNCCPYCDTSYFDLTSIDFDSRKPVFLKFKQGGMIVTTKCIPELKSVESSCETTCFTDVLGRDIHQFVTNKTVNTNIGFTSIPMGNDCIYKLEVER